MSLVQPRILHMQRSAGAGTQNDGFSNYTVTDGQPCGYLISINKLMPSAKTFHQSSFVVSKPRQNRMGNCNLANLGHATAHNQAILVFETAAPSPISDPNPGCAFLSASP